MLARAELDEKVKAFNFGHSVAMLIEAPEASQHKGASVGSIYAAAETFAASKTCQKGYTADKKIRAKCSCACIRMSCICMACFSRGYYLDKGF